MWLVYLYYSFSDVVMAASPVKSTMKSQLPISVIPFSCKTINPKELVEKLLHSQSEVFIMDCRPTLAYNSIHISGALGINLNPMMTKRLKAGKQESHFATRC